MYRASTPLHEWLFDIDPVEMKEILITFSQKGQIVLEKTKADMTFEPVEIKGEPRFIGRYSLSQEETCLFESKMDVEVQCRVLTYAGASLPTDIMRVPVKHVLDDRIME